MSFLRSCNGTLAGSLRRSFHTSAQRHAASEGASSSERRFGNTTNRPNRGTAQGQSRFAADRGTLGSVHRESVGAGEGDPSSSSASSPMSRSFAPSGTSSAQLGTDGTRSAHDVNSPAGFARSLPVLQSVQPVGPAAATRKKKFSRGRTYAPGNLNVKNMYEESVPRALPLLGPSRAIAEQKDPLFKLGLRPGHPSLHDDSYKNPVLLSAYVTDMGKIMSRRESNLTWRSQREVGKAVRRARAMGLMPVMAKFRRGY